MEETQTTRERSAILQTDKLTRRFNHLVAADAVTISVTAGEVFRLVGPKGVQFTARLLARAGSSELEQTLVVLALEDLSRLPALSA